MDILLQWLSYGLIATGSFVVVVGALGLIRMPDVFTRMHAAGMIDTMGATLLFVGMGLTAGLSLVTLKLFVLWLLFFFTSPAASHALARAALYAGVKPYLAKDDHLQLVSSKYGLLSSSDEEHQS
ncbi:MAG: monovalent cation/H(+) antiporter subunit G [Methyloligellaceae bacterium]